MFLPLHRNDLHHALRPSAVGSRANCNSTPATHSLASSHTDLWRSKYGNAIGGQVIKASKDITASNLEQWETLPPGPEAVRIDG